MPADAFCAENEGNDGSHSSLAYRSLCQLPFGEHAIEEVANGWQQRGSQRRERWETPRQAEMEGRCAEVDRI